MTRVFVSGMHQQGRSCRSLKATPPMFSSVTVTPDGSKIISGSGDYSVRVWDTSTGKELQKLEGHTSVCLLRRLSHQTDRRSSQDLATTAFVSGIHQQGRSCRFLKATPNLLSPPSPSHQTDRRSSQDLRTTAFVSGIHQQGRSCRSLKATPPAVYSVTVTPDGSKIISGSGDNSVRVWDTSTGKDLQKLEGHTPSVGCGAMTPGVPPCVAVCDGNGIRICAASWRLRTVIGIGTVVSVPFQCAGIDTVTPTAACSVLGGAVAAA